MSLYDITGDYPGQTIERPSTTRGIFSSLLAALRRPHDHGATTVVEDANAAKHRRREQGYLHDIGI